MAEDISPVMAQRRNPEFPAKLLLFGEYSILLGSSALSLPVSAFGASLKFISSASGDGRLQAEESNIRLRMLRDFFLADSPVFGSFLDLNKLCSDIGNGLYLESDIPQCYGMGSSGALCAAIYSRYATEPGDMRGDAGLKNIAKLRKSFSLMESCFHGKSSGFDPLVSFLGTPLLLDRSGEIATAGFHLHSMAENGIHLLLIDSGQPSGTGPLVARFLSEFAPGGITTSAGGELCSMVDSTINNLLQRNMEEMWNGLHSLSHFQQKHLCRLIPGGLLSLWSEGLRTGLYTLKLCGSGGGGFLLCFTREKEKSINFLRSIQISFIPVVE